MDTKRRWTELLTDDASSSAESTEASPSCGLNASWASCSSWRIDWNSIKSNKLSNCFIALGQSSVQSVSVANERRIGTAAAASNQGMRAIRWTAGRNKIRLPVVWKMEATSAGGSLCVGLGLIHGIYSPGGVLMSKTREAHKKKWASLGIRKVSSQARQIRNRS